eukprot:1161047-Pelagomonas_calceolata.AAC.8
MHAGEQKGPTIGHKFVKVLRDLLGHHIGPSLLVGWRREHGHEHVLRDRRKRLQWVLPLGGAHLRQPGSKMID